MLKLLITSVSIFCGGSVAMAVEKSYSAKQRYALVGVIAESDASGAPSGIVVIRDKHSGKNLTLRSGDKLPQGLSVSHIKRNNVVLATAAGEKIRIAFEGSAKKDQSAVNSELDSIYQAQLEELEDRFIDEQEIVHVYEAAEDAPGDGYGGEYDDQKRLWHPVRTGDNLRYVLEAVPGGESRNSEPTYDQ